MNSLVNRVLVAMVIGTIAPCALGAEWAIEPSIESRASNTDNINLTPNVHENVLGISVSPRVTFARRTEATEVAGTASLGINRYPGNSGLDTDDASLSLTSQLRGERSSYGLSAAYIRDSTLQTELATTGIVQTRRQRDLVTLSPSWSYSLTERSSVFAQYRYDQAKYQAGAGLSDYSSQQGSGGYQYLLSERTTATLSGGYSRYKTDDGSILTNSNSVNIGLTHNPIERLTLALGIGARRSDTKITNTVTFCPFGSVIICNAFGIPLETLTATSNTSDNGLSYNASADYKWESMTANFVASRDIYPTGTGLVVQTDRFAIGIGHQFSEKLSGNASAAYLFSRYIGGLASDTEYYRLDSGLSWKLDQWWSAGAGYSFAYQRVKGVPDNASANTVYLSISYNWPKISISR
jgi:hypothetical protein